MTNLNGVYAIIIEDNASDAKVLATLLKRLNVQVDALGNDILGELAQVPQVPHVIFLDLEMQGLNGYDVIEALQANQDFAEVPVVAYTSHSSEMVNARAAGFHSFLGKPLESSVFGEQLTDILNGTPVWEVREP
jgi:CheY-like chemotaxis protein